MWGISLRTHDDVFATFLKYLQRRIRFLPWCDSIAPETDGEIKVRFFTNNKSDISEYAPFSLPSSHVYAGSSPTDFAFRIHFSR